MAEDGVTRRLAAILAADVAGYTRLMEADEDATIAAWKAARTDVIDPKIAEFEGRIVKHTGDGFLAEFNAVTDAVNCAVDIQEALAASPLDFRMGVNLGDVIEELGDIHGEGVNVAARLEGLAEPGGICVSSDVYNQVRNKLDLAFEDMGEQAMKNIAHPVRAFRVMLGGQAVLPARRRKSRTPASWWWAAAVVLLAVAGGIAAWLQPWAPPPEVAVKPEAQRLSLFVLPFDNLSGDPKQDYFADAITDDLITDLSRIRGAFVIARRTSFAFKGKATDVKKVAAELGVRYVLEGSVRRSGDQVRINAQLIDGQTGSHVWSARFDRVLTDVFSLQNDVTGQIAAVLKGELREAQNLRRGPPASLEAWDYALQGNVLLHYPTGPKAFLEAKGLLEKALELDPDIASAWSGLAFVHYVASTRAIPGVSVPHSTRLAIEAAQKAVSLDPKSAEAHWVIGLGYTRNRQPERGLASCDTALALNPNNDCAYMCAGLTNVALGKAAEALPFFRQSLRLNPRFRPFLKYTYMGIANVHLGQHKEAVSFLNKAVADFPNDPTVNFALASALAWLGRMDEARAALAKYMTLAAGQRNTVETLRASYSWFGPDFERVLEGLRRAGMPER